MHTAHGVALNIFGFGVMLTGDSGIGKTELGLELVSRGHRFIADDVVNIETLNKQLLIHNQSKKFIVYLHNIGFIDIESIYGTYATMAKSGLDLIINLTNNNNPDPLYQAITHTTILGIPVTTYELYIGKSRSLALLTEILIKYHQQKACGKDSHQEFINYIDGKTNNAANFN